MEFHFVVTPEPISRWQSVTENSRLLLDQNPGAAQMSVSRIHSVSLARSRTFFYLLGLSKTFSEQCGPFRGIPSHIAKSAGKLTLLVDVEKLRPVVWVIVLKDGGAHDVLGQASQ